MKTRRIPLPFTEKDLKKVRAGDRLLLTGTLYTARDDIHRRMHRFNKSGKKFPVNLKQQVIYYTGPAPQKPGQIINSVGPTTAKRMDKYTSDVLKLGVIGMIGKGPRGTKTRKLIKGKAIYMASLGGVSAKLAKKVVKHKLVAFKDGGMEAMRKLEVVDFPVFVINDLEGNDAYEIQRREYSKTRE